MEPDPYITWPPHPDDHVEDLFRQASRDDFVIVHLDGIYTLISPDGTQEMQFQDYVVPSSAAWRVVVRQLELWLEQMKDDSGGAVMAAFKISIKATVSGNTARFLAFTVSSDRTARTALFAMCVEEDDPVKAVAAAYSWVVTAINATGDGAYGWEMAARPEERERILA